MQIKVASAQCLILLPGGNGIAYYVKTRSGRPDHMTIERPPPDVSSIDLLANFPEISKILNVAIQSYHHVPCLIPLSVPIAWFPSFKLYIWPNPNASRISDVRLPISTSIPLAFQIVHTRNVSK